MPIISQISIIILFSWDLSLLIVKSPYNILTHYSSPCLANLAIQHQGLSVSFPNHPPLPYPTLSPSLFFPSFKLLKCPENQKNLPRTKKLSISKCQINTSEESDLSTSGSVLGYHRCHWTLISQRFGDDFSEPSIWMFVLFFFEEQWPHSFYYYNHLRKYSTSTPRYSTPK